MPFADLSRIVPALIVMDVLIVIVFVVFLWKSKTLNIEEGLQKKIEVFESLMVDADHLSIHLKKNLEEKYLALKNLEEKIDHRINQLQQLLDNADQKMVSLDAHEKDARERVAAPELNQEQQILRMVKEGMDLETIAGHLSIPRGKVKLVLDLNRDNH